MSVPVWTHPSVRIGALPLTFSEMAGRTSATHQRRNLQQIPSIQPSAHICGRLWCQWIPHRITPADL